jgi:hypothetical protein
MSVDDAWIQRSCAPHARCPLKDRPEHVLTTRCRIAGQFEWGLCVLLAWPVLVDLFLIVWPLASKSWHWIQWLAIRRWSNFYLGSTWVKLYLGLCFRFKSICCVTWLKIRVEQVVISLYCLEYDSRESLLGSQELGRHECNVRSSWILQDWTPYRNRNQS